MTGQGDDGQFIRPYMSKRQLAEVTPWSVAAIDKMVARGILKLRIHYSKPFGRRDLVFKWEAIKAEIEKNPGLSDLGDDMREPQLARKHVAQIEEDFLRMLS